MSGIDPSPYALERGRALSSAPLQHRYAVRLGVSPDALFAFITDFPRLPEWMPLIKRVRVDDTRSERPGQLGAVRVIEAPVGRPTQEVVKAFEQDKLLAYSATDASLMGMVRDHLGVLCTEPHPDGGTWFTWLSFGKPGSVPMRWFGDLVFSFVIGRSISNLERRFPV